MLRLGVFILVHNGHILIAQVSLGFYLFILHLYFSSVVTHQVIDEGETPKLLSTHLRLRQDKILEAFVPDRSQTPRKPTGWRGRLSRQ